MVDDRASRDLMYREAARNNGAATFTARSRFRLEARAIACGTPMDVADRLIVDVHSRCFDVTESIREAARAGLVRSISDYLEGADRARGWGP